jgi:hypothetical protein
MINRQQRQKSRDHLAAFWFQGAAFSSFQPKASKAREKK